MDKDKCKDCKWRVVMSFTDGTVVRMDDIMCHWNWKRIEKVREDECHYNKKCEAKS